MAPAFLGRHAVPRHSCSAARLDELIGNWVEGRVRKALVACCGDECGTDRRTYRLGCVRKGACSRARSWCLPGNRGGTYYGKAESSDRDALHARAAV